MTDRELNKVPTLLLPIAFSSIFCIIVLLFNFLFAENERNNHSTQPYFGQWGDAFGIANSIFTALTLIFLVTGIFYQREELNAARQSIREQEGAANKQIFENTFFQLLKNLEDRVSNIAFTIGNKEHSGISSVSKLTAKAAGVISSLEEGQRISRKEFRIIKNIDNGQMVSISNLIFLIVFFIHNAQVEDKSLYFRILKSHLTPSIKLYFALWLSGTKNIGSSTVVKHEVENNNILTGLNPENKLVNYLHSYFEKSAFITPIDEAADDENT